MSTDDQKSRTPPTIDFNLPNAYRRFGPREEFVFPDIHEYGHSPLDWVPPNQRPSHTGFELPPIKPMTSEERRRLLDLCDSLLKQVPPVEDRLLILSTMNPLPHDSMLDFLESKDLWKFQSVRPIRESKVEKHDDFQRQAWTIVAGAFTFTAGLLAAFGFWTLAGIAFAVPVGIIWSALRAFNRKAR